MTAIMMRRSWDHLREDQEGAFSKTNVPKTQYPHHATDG